MILDVPPGYAVFIFRAADDVAEAVAIAVEKREAANDRDA